MPSGPGAPALRSTALSAASQLAASTALSIVASCIAIFFPGFRMLSGVPLSSPLKMAAPSGRFGFAQSVVVPHYGLLTFGRLFSRFTGSLVALQSFLRPFAPPCFRTASSLLWPLLTPAVALA